MTDTDRLPPERRLPPTVRDQILRSVLTGEEPDMTHRSRIRWIAPLAVGAAAALIAIGAVALSNRDSEQPGGAPPAVEPTEQAVPLDHGPLTAAEVQEAVGPEVDENDLIPYARRIAGPDQPVPIVVAITNDAQATFFETGELAGTLEIPAPTAAEPIRGVDNPWGPDIADAIYRDLPGHWKLAGVYRVADTVDRVEVRVGTPDGPEPWRLAEPHGGFVFWATWFKPADYQPGTELTVEWRAYDTDGNQIDPTALPDKPQPVTVPGPADGS